MSSRAHQALPLQTVSIIQAGDAASADTARQWCAQLQLAVATVTTPADMAAGVASTAVQVHLLTSSWETPELQRALHYLHETDAATAILLYDPSTVPPAAQLATAGIFGAVSAHDTLDTVACWLQAAAEMTAARRALARADRQLTDIDALYALEQPVHDAASIPAQILDTAITIIAHDMDAGAQSSVTGAVLMRGEDGQFQVRTARPPYDACVEQALPGDLHALALQAAEHHTVMQTARHLALPLAWSDRMRGVLLLEAESMPKQAGDLLHLLAHCASSVLENDILFNLAAIDLTTGMVTRTFAMQRLFETLKGSYRSGQDLTVLMMDLDSFKHINDTYGHLTGDRVLHEVGSVLRAQLRDTDVLGRYGGDEFQAILPNTPLYGGIEVAQRLRRKVGEVRIDVNDIIISPAVSIGIGGIRYEDFATNTLPVRVGHSFFQQALEMIIAQTDGLMYRAKHETTTHIASGPPLTWDSLLRLQGLRDSGLTLRV